MFANCTDTPKGVVAKVVQTRTEIGHTCLSKEENFSCLTKSTAVPKGNVAKEVQVLTINFFRRRICCMKQEEVTISLLLL
jgi:hypothetical protein